jgi:hypothetical protein
MLIKSVFFCSIFFTSVILTASLSHLLSLNNKIKMPASEYLIAQKVYYGWALLAIPVVLTLISVLVQLILLRRGYQGSGLTFAAFIILALTQVIFWLFTFPANKQSNNWTKLPSNWEKLRIQWEYSHATAAVLNLLVLVLLILALLKNLRTHT